MAGPYPQHSDGSAGPPRYGEPYPSQPFAAQPMPAEDYPQTYPPHPPRKARGRRWGILGALLVVVAVIAGASVAVFYGLRSDSADSTAEGFTPATAEVAIQNFLDALTQGDTDTITRNTLCGMYDAVRDLRSDKALAKLASEAFRDQFSRAEVLSIDKIVLLSSHQAQVLFTMRVAPVTRGTQKTEEQATAALLIQDNRLFVCQYLLRSGAQF